MGCILKQEDESVASGRFRTREVAILARYIRRAFGGTIFVRFWSVNLCFVLNNIICLSHALFFSFMFSHFITSIQVDPVNLVLASCIQKSYSQTNFASVYVS